MIRFQTNNNNFFAPYGAYNTHWANQNGEGNDTAPNESPNLPQLSQLPMPNFQLLSQIAGQLINLKVSQITAYTYQMAQVSAQFFDQLYTQHKQMVQQAYDQDNQMVKQFDKMIREAAPKAEIAENAAEKPAEKKAEKPAEKAEK